MLEANCNLRLGDMPQQVIFTNRGQTTWAFRSGDRFLLGTNGSGAFRNDAFGQASYPFGPILYLASKAYKVGLSADDRTLQVEPWPEPLAEVALPPRGELVHHLTLAWQCPDGHWQSLRPAVTGGKVLVPPGDYRLYGSTLLGKGAAGDQVRLDGWQWTPQTPVRFAAGKANTLNCGAPLQIKVTANAVSGPTPGIWERYFRGRRLPQTVVATLQVRHQRSSSHQLPQPYARPIGVPLVPSRRGAAWQPKGPWF